MSADSTTPKGTRATLTVRIDDGQTDPVQGTVVVEVTASTRPLATANDDTVAEAHQGSTVSVPVLDNDFNPFPDKPLKVVAAVTETGSGFAEVVGNHVEVSPAETFVGTMVVRYRIQDATGDVDREVEGRIVLTVQGRPEAPGTPSVSSVQDRTVVLSWTPPADNGAAITGYTVSSTHGDYQKHCAATTCTLDGLTNNVEYNFTVIATNRVGDSDPSAPSETARPDARPDTPAPPTLAFADRSLNVAWVTPTTPGSPVESFTLEISPAPPSGIAQKTGVTGNSLVWDGLENGVAYQVRVQAHNRAPDPSSWSGWSATEVPARAPEPPAAPSVARLQPVGDQAQLQVSWQQPATNGADIAGYELQVLQGGSVVRSIPNIPAGQLSQAVSLTTSTTDYTFRVRASNKAGWSAWGATSAPRRAFGQPGAPSAVSAAPGDRRLTVSYSPAPGNGASGGELGYEYSLNGGGWTALPGNNVITGLNNGTSYRVALRAYTALDGVRYDGQASAQSAAQIPYGPVGNPGASASRSGRDITFGWSAPAENGRAITQVQIRIDGGGWQNVANSGSRTDTLRLQHDALDRRARTGCRGPVERRAIGVGDDRRPAAATCLGDSRWLGSGAAQLQHVVVRVLLREHAGLPGGHLPRLLRERSDGEFAGGAQRSLPANGSTQLGCYYGKPNTQVWVRIEGWGESEHTTWH